MGVGKLVKVKGLEDIQFVFYPDLVVLRLLEELPISLEGYPRACSCFGFWK